MKLVLAMFSLSLVRLIDTTRSPGEAISVRDSLLVATNYLFFCGCLMPGSVSCGLQEWANQDDFITNKLSLSD